MIIPGQDIIWNKYNLWYNTMRKEIILDRATSVHGAVPLGSTSHDSLSILRSLVARTAL